MEMAAMRTDANRAAILAHLGARGPASRADLARALDLSPALLTKLTRDLLADGLLNELEHQPSRGGRPARQLGLASNAIGAIGLKIAPDHLTLVEVGIDGVVTRTSTAGFDATDRLALRSLVDITTGFIGEGDHSQLLGIGVGLPGSVLGQSEDLVDSTQLQWNQVPLGSALRSATGLPVLIDNNVSALALAEALYGVGRGHEDFLVVTIGSGIGAGIVANGAIVRGHTGNAGEIGHIPVVENGPLCQCGAAGCLEALIGQAGLMREATARGIVIGGTLADVTALADGGDHDAQGVFTAAGKLLGRAIAGVVNTLDPQIVVVLGEGASSWRHWSRGFEPSFRAALIPRKRGVEVAVEAWQDDRWAQGAACLVLGTPFDATGVSGEQGERIRTRLTEVRDTEASA
ncbi:ROK family transcriptional regulator [Demequina aestuarii]|uniref:ROK family transcriptional regulator n=1 Tax=Demequina aestuarii TaxID=327095 RepID=UPI000780B61B|nr:ROK family transcriptional regulator [Demequina aestuarii]